MAYSDDIIALSPDHLWTFDNVLTDSVGTATGVGTSISYSTPTAEDATNSMNTNAVGDRVTMPTLTTLNNADHDRKTVGGWFYVTDYQLPPKTIYREGATSLKSLQFVMWAGNKLMFEISTDTTGVVTQAISNKILKPDRNYHILGKMEGTGYGDFVKLFVDGIEQDVTLPADGSLGAVAVQARGVAVFGDSAGTTYVGQGVVILNAPTNGRYNHWASWVGANAQLTDTEIREELFAKGAIPEQTITSQANLTTYADTLRDDTPLAFAITGTSLDLIADNVTFDPLCSLHIRWEGTGVLNWTNNNGSNASTFVATNGGTVNIINPSILDISGLIAGSLLEIYDNETVDYENDNTVLFSTTVAGTSYQYNHSGTANDIVIKVFKSGYKEIRQPYTIGSQNDSLQLFPQQEDN